MILPLRFVFLWALVCLPVAAAQTDFRGNEFVGLNSFTNFAETKGATETVLTSPVISPHIAFNQVIVSWNVELPQNAYLIVEGRAIYDEHSAATKYYNLGHWSTNPAQHPRQSVSGQSDADGDVSTDTLILRRLANKIQIRLTLGGSGVNVLKFLGITLTDTNAAPTQLPPNREAWGKLIPVIERTQMAYPNGGQLCSPTTVSMLMNHWAQALKRPELDRSVPEIVDAIYDSQWKGTGNWPFNMAYAGSFPAMRAYATRMSDISELEAWIAKGIPVGLSVDYDRLRAKGRGTNGHLVVLVGFTNEGDAIINDPGTTLHVRKTFPRKHLIDAWSNSRNAVYLIYPESVTPPEDTFGHWSSH
jgi:hypothetical protein